MEENESITFPLPETELVMRPIVYADLMDLLKSAEMQARAMKSRAGDSLAATISKAIGVTNLFEIDTPSRRAKPVIPPGDPREVDRTDLGLSVELADGSPIPLVKIIDMAKSQRRAENRAFREIERAGMA